MSGTNERCSHAGSAGEQRGITILDRKPIRRNTLCGFASAKIERRGRAPEGCCPLGESAQQADAPCRRQRLARIDGRVRYQPLLQCDRKTADRFSAAVVAGLFAHHPDAFDAEALP